MSLIGVINQVCVYLLHYQISHTVVVIEGESMRIQNVS